MTADAINRRVQTYKQVFSPRLFADAPAGCDSTAPLFVVGLPRSGSTLVEQILASHSSVEGTLELPDIGHLVEELTRTASERAGDSYPQTLERLSSTDLRMLGEAYLERTRIHRKRGPRASSTKCPTTSYTSASFTSFCPGHASSMCAVIPWAPASRPSNSTLPRAKTFSYELTELGRYYRDYVDLMGHFDAVLPGQVHRVIYEDLVTNPEDEIRRLLKFCELPFESACLRFYETDRPVRTVSSEQVRRPLYRDALERWRNYEPWLGPLHSALGATLKNWRA